MVIREEVVIDNQTYIHHYSDQNLYIKNDQTGGIYADALDIITTYTYSETDIPIEDEQEEEA